MRSAQRVQGYVQGPVKVSTAPVCPGRAGSGVGVETVLLVAATWTAA